MTVIRPNSISGITSITAQANEINFFRSNGTLASLQLNGVNFNTTTGISTFAALKVTGNLDVEGVLTYQDVTNVDSLGIGTFRTGINVSGGQLDVGSNIKLGNAGVITATSFVGDGSNLTGLSATSDKIEEGNSKVEVIDSGTGRIKLNIDGNSAAIVSRESMNRTYMIVGNAVAVENDYGTNTGNVIIASNTTTRTATLRVFTTGVGMADDTVTGIIDFAAQQSGTGGQTVSKIESSLRDGVENKSDLIFSTSNAGSPTEKLRIHSSGLIDAATSFNNTYSSTTGITPHIRIRNQLGADNIYGGIQLRADRNNGAASIFNIACLTTSTSYESPLVLQSRNSDGNFSEKLRITSDGKIGINQSSPQKLLDVYNTSTNESNMYVRNASVNYLVKAMSDQVQAGSETNHPFYVISNNQYVARFDGDGVKFGSDSAAANALNDYEEGSFTPGTPSYSSTAATGQYTKIGNTVHYQAQIAGISGSAPFIISNLPFAVDAGWGGTIGITNHGSQDHYYPFPHQGMSQMYVRNSSNNTYNTSGLQGKFFYVWGTYITNS